MPPVGFSGVVERDDDVLARPLLHGGGDLAERPPVDAARARVTWPAPTSSRATSPIPPASYRSVAT